ncbi:MAG TPA: cupin domain-containing protein [Gaiellaceae bacterium]|nr:cupin domain-containing protein [Gaiellaceae bacterium]
MSKGYEVLSLDDLGAYPRPQKDGPLLMPLRLRLGVQAFGANCWTAPVGSLVVPRHEEDSGHEELYVIVRGRATFTVGEQTFDAPAGTLVHVEAGVLREAVAEEPDTVVLVAGGTPGKAFEAFGWESVQVAFAEGVAGRVEEGRTALNEAIAGRPGHWSNAYNLACYESRFGDLDAAFAQLREALATAPPEEIGGYLEGDDDLARMRDDPRWAEVTG